MSGDRAGSAPAASWIAGARPAAVALSPGAGSSLRAPVRIDLDSFHVEIGGAAVRSSTTIGSVGGYVVVVATTVPDGYERLSAQVLPPRPAVGEHARACLLDHAAEIQQALADLTGAQILVDVAAGARERAAEA